MGRYEGKPWVCYRYIDDVLHIWMHGEERLSSFVEYINSYHLTITFNMDILKDSIRNLDVLANRNSCFLETDLYCESTNAHKYLQELLPPMACQKGNPIRTGYQD